MLTLYRRGRVYWLRGCIAGRRIHRSCRTSERAIAEQIKADRERREWKRHLYGAEAVLTFSAAAILYLKAGKSPRFLRPVMSFWKDTPVKDITAGGIRQAAVTLYPRASAATRNRQAIVPTQAVINHAAENELCSPIKVKRFPVQKTILPASSLQWLEAFAANSPPRLAALAWFLFLTGSRIGTATNLRWSDVDLSAGEAILRKPKGQDDARVHLPPFLVAALANLEGPREEWRRVFGWSGRGSVYKPWQQACARAGLPYIPPHRAGRHGFATGLLREGVDPVTVAKLGHWKSARHVYETYGHAIEDRTLTEKLLRREPR